MVKTKVSHTLLIIICQPMPINNFFAFRNVFNMFYSTHFIYVFFIYALFCEYEPPNGQILAFAILYLAFAFFSVSEKTAIC